MTYEAEVHTVLMSSPDDVSQVKALFDSGAVDPAHVVAVMSQTEGDGFARGYSALALRLLFGNALKIPQEDIFDRIPMLMIGGVAGLMTPHHTVFVNRPAKKQGSPTKKKLVIGVQSTRALLPEEYATMVQVRLVADAVRDAMRAAEISNAEDVLNIQIKCPGMTAARINDARQRGQKVVDNNLASASGKSRGASVLGAALALGEVDQAKLNDGVIGQDANLYSNKTFASSGNEQVGCRVVVLGNVAGSSSSYVVGSSLMEHQLDLDGARKAFEEAGLRLENGTVHAGDQSRIAAVFVKAGADQCSDILGNRHTLKTDFLAGYAGFIAKAVAHALVSGIKGDTLVMGNVGAEHQGAPGANLVCVIARE